MVTANLSIGVTERGDAGLDLSWLNKLDTVSGVILITKNVTSGSFKNALFQAYNSKRAVMLHCGCTGWGQTAMEPNVPDYKTQLDSLNNIIEAGFPTSHCVLRVDPIIPTEEGFHYAYNVFKYAHKLGLLNKLRIRISIFDEYPHVRTRFAARGYDPVYNQFYAPESLLEIAKQHLIQWANEFSIKYETCAEPFLNNDCFVHCGCVSLTDLSIMGIQASENSYLNPQGRNGCLCLGCKRELLQHRHPCGHNCAYCYWKD